MEWTKSKAALKVENLQYAGGLAAMQSMWFIDNTKKTYKPSDMLLLVRFYAI